MKGRRKFERIIAIILSLVFVWSTFGGVLPVSATTEESVPSVETETTEAPSATDIVSEEPTEAPTEMSTDEATAEPTAEPTVAPTEIPEESLTVSGVITFAGKAIDEKLSGHLVITGEEKTYYSFTTDKKGKYSFIPDTEELDDGKYTVALQFKGFDATNSISEVEIKDGLIVTENDSDVLELNADLSLAEIELIKVNPDDNVWVVNKQMDYLVDNYNIVLDYSYSSESIFDFTMKYGNINITPQLITENGREIAVSVSYNGVKKTSIIDIGVVAICEPNVKLNLESITKPNVSEQRIDVTVNGLDKKMPGTVQLSCVIDENQPAQGTFYVLKDGKKVECPDGIVELSECADKSGNFVCYYVAKGKYANYGFEGKFTYNVAYSGVENRYKEAAASVEAVYNSVNPIYFTIDDGNDSTDDNVIATTNNVDITYGTVDYVVPVNFDASKVAEYTNTFKYELVDGNNNVIEDTTDLPYTIAEETAEDGTVTAKVVVNRVNKEGEVVRVKVTRESKKTNADGTEVDASASAYLEINVVPATITAVIGDNKINAAKTYDYTDTVTIYDSVEAPLNISLNDILSDDEGKVKVESITGTATKVNSNDEAEDDVLTVTAINLAGESKDNYVVELTEQVKINISLKINKRKIALSAGNAEKTYNVEGLTAVDAESIVTVDPNSFDDADIEHGVSPESIIIPDAIVVWSDGAKETKGTHADVVVPDISSPVCDKVTGNAFTNYEFIVKDCGDLTVNAEEIGNAWGQYLSVGELNYKTENYEKIWFTINKTVEFNLLDEDYDVLLLLDEENQIVKEIANANDESVVFAPEDLTNGNTVYEYNVCLGTKTADGQYINTSESFKLSFILDDQVPEVEIKDGESFILNEEFPELRFTIISKIAKTLEVSVMELPEDKDIASGIKQWSYAKKNFDKALNAAEMQDFVDSNDNDLVWSDSYDSTTTACRVVVGGDAETLEDGNYVVFVKVKDNAGNSKIYTSAGMVLEDNAPKASIVIESKSTGDDGYYNYKEGIKVNVHAVDEKVDSGIKNVYLHVAANEDEKLDADAIVNAEDKTVLGESSTVSTGEVYVLKEAAADYVVDVDGENDIFDQVITIDETDSWDITDGVIQLVVEDYAGYRTVAEEVNFVIDKVEPEITVAPKEIPAYTKDDVEITFDITEVNYDINKVNIDVKKGISSAIYSLKEYEYNEDDYVKVDCSDEKKIKVTVKNDGDYTITLNCTDKAGNSVSTESVKFIIDKTAPTMKVEYDFVDPENNKRPEDDNERYEKLYFNDSINVKFTFTEINADMKEAAPKIILSSDDEITDEEPMKLDWTGENGVYTCIVPLTDDARYRFAVEYTDPVGLGIEKVENLVSPIVVDTAEPTMNISVLENAWKVFFETITFGIFSNDSVVEIGYEAVEPTNGSGIVTFAYFIDDPEKVDEGVVRNKTYIENKFNNILEGNEDIVTGLTYEVIANNNYDDIKHSYDGAIEIAADQRAVAYFMVVDAAGWKTYYNSDGIIVENDVPEINVSNFDDINVNTFKSVDEIILNISVKDPNEVWSGLKNVSYKIEGSGNKISKTLEGDLYVNENYIDSEKTIKGKGQQSFEEKWNLLTAFDTKDEDFDFINEFNCNNVKITLTAEDMAGNKADVVVLNFAIDATAPTITASYDNNNAYDNNNNNKADDKHLKGDRTLTVQFTERNFLRENAEITVNYTSDDATNPTEYKFNDSRTALVNASGETIAEVSWTDSEDKVEYPNYTDDRINTAVIKFTEDGDYEITRIYCKDTVGNEPGPVEFAKEDIARLAFTLDSKAPELSFTKEYSINPNDPYNGGIYYQAPRTDKFTITEHNYSEELVIINLGYVLHEDNDVKTNKVSNYTDYTLAGLLAGSYKDLPFSVTLDESVENAADTRTYLIKYEANAYYDLKSITCTDLAGNVDETDEATGQFCIDATAADLGQVKIAGANKNVVIENGKVSIEENREEKHTWEWSSSVLPKEEIADWYVSETDLTVTLVGEDKLSGIDSISYYTTTEIIESVENIEWISAEPKAVTDNLNMKEFTFEITPQYETLIYLKLVNKAGVQSYYVTDGIIVETIAPIITINNADELNDQIFNEAISLDVTVDDNESLVWSGIQKAWYQITAEGNVNEAVIGEMNIGEGTYAGRQNRGTVMVNGQIPVSTLSKFNSNNVTVTVFAMDVAGNESISQSVNFAIDVTSPTIAASYDNNTALNNKYFKEDRTLTVQFTERNFMHENAEIIVNYTSDDVTASTEYKFNSSRTALVNASGRKIAEVSWTDSQAGVDYENYTDARVNTAVIEFTEDGDYEIESISCEDTVGNSTDAVAFAEDTVAAEDFTLDAIKPVIELSYDNNNAKNGNFYNKVRTATVKITEHNFKAAEVAEDIKAKLDGAGITAPVMSDFTSNGNVHTATIKYLADGDYTFDIEYTDLAGNQADDFTADSFTVDTVAPEIEFFDIEDKSANNGIVSPGIRYSDINYDKEEVTIKIVGANNGPVSIERVRSSIENGQSIKLNDFAHIEEMDDLYTIYVLVADKAGNETEKEIQFSVNRFGSVYVFGSDECKNWVESVYHNEEAEIYIKEINVDIVEESVVSVSLDGELTELVSGNDYTATKGSTNTGWSEIHYKLSNTNFAEEGSYKVTFSSKDRAGNSMDNENARKEGAQCNVEFVIDKTAPTIVIGGIIDDKQYYEASRTVTVDAQDAIALKEVVVDINGEEVIYTVDVDTETGNKKPLRDAKNHQNEIKEIIESNSDWQEVSVVATDMAGNAYAYGEQEPGDGGTPIRVLITRNLLIQYYKNTPLFIGSIIGIIVIAGVIVFLISKKKKNNNA